MKLKEKDLEVINLLRRGESVDSVANKLKIPKSTVYYHVNKLKKAGMIRGMKVSFQYGDDAENGSAIILVSLDRVNSKEMTAFMDRLKAHKDMISEVYGISGDWDFALFIHGKRGQLQNFVQNTLHFAPNVKRTNSLFVMKQLEL